VIGCRITLNAQNAQHSRNSERRRLSVSANSAISAVSLLIVIALCGACGKKGPPLPPLVRLPAAPADVGADRRGDEVDLHFVVPSANTDGTRPANVAAAEVYAITAPASGAPPTYTDAQLLKYGTKVASIEVKAPRDPNLTADADEPADEVDPPEGNGLDQGATARISEPLSADALKPIAVPADLQSPVPQQTTVPTGSESGPLLGPAAAPPSRTYAAVGLSARGKRGPLSRRVVVPLVPPPAALAAPTIKYDETAITLTWPPIVAITEPPATDDVVLPSRIIGETRPEILYNVYDVGDADGPIKLTAAPIAEPKYSDARIAWGATRCYAVRAAARVAGAVVESDASPAQCETLADTFPPAAPKGLAAIASEGAINLIWEPNAEKDLAGYLVLRGSPASAALEPITPAPIQETSFRDGVQPGVTFVYALKAVDRAGNASEASARVTETAR